MHYLTIVCSLQKPWVTGQLISLGLTGGISTINYISLIYLILAWYALNGFTQSLGVQVGLFCECKLGRPTSNRPKKENKRFELLRRQMPTWRFSRPFPSATWVILRKIYISSNANIDKLYPQITASIFIVNSYQLKRQYEATMSANYSPKGKYGIRTHATSL